MLKSRIITALILAPLALLGIWKLPPLGFALFAAVIFVLGSWEWSRISGIRHVALRLCYLGLILGLLYLAYMALQEQLWTHEILLLALAWWVLGLISVVLYPRSEAIWYPALLRMPAGVLILVPAWYALCLLQQSFGPGFVILLVLLIWAADTGAYFAGRRFGRHKLAPQVSPGKTWEGVIGGVLLALLVAVIASQWLEIHDLPAFIAVTAVTVAVSVLGDLLESLFKRVADVKDSGGLLPGHGGVLDRIDSLTAAAPVFALGMLWLAR